jgi:K+-sensing histidine kinase KdpD
MWNQGKLSRFPTGLKGDVRPSSWLGYPTAIVGSAFLTLILAPFQTSLSSTTVALAFLLVVLFLELSYGSRPALFASLVSVACFNFFFLPPLYTFTITDSRNWVAFGAFLVTALTVGQLSARASARAEESERQRREIERLYIELKAAVEKNSEAEAIRRSEQLKSALLDAGSSVITAVNIQHLESLNDVIARTTGVQVRETIPDQFLRRANEVVNVDVSVDTLRTRLRQGKIYSVETIEQSLNNFFRKGNLTALRQLAEDQAAKAQNYRSREGLECAVIPEKVMVCMASHGSAKKLLRVGSRIAGRLASDWFAVYVETPREEAGRIPPADYVALQENIRFAEELGAKVVRLKGRRVADALMAFARREGITHVIFGQSARSRWDLLLHGSVIHRFLTEVRAATVQIVPTTDTTGNEF